MGESAATAEERFNAALPRPLGPKTFANSSSL